MKGIPGLLTTISNDTQEERADGDNSNASESDSISIDPSTVTVEEGNAATPNEKGNNLVTIIKKIREGTIHKLRLDGTVEVYKLYCELFYPSIIGKQKWKMNHCHIGIKTLTTVADEALVALLLENNIEEWIILANRGTINAMDRKTKYTHGGPGRNGTKKGWSLEGRKRYNTLHGEVKAVRNDQNATVTDESLKRLWSTAVIPRSLRHVAQDDESTQATESMEQEFEPVFDFDD